MKKIVFLMMLLAVMPAAAKKKVTTPAPEVQPTADNVLTEQEQREGWKLLWDGKTTNGWRGAKLDAFPDKGWKIEDGVLKVLAADGGESIFFFFIVFLPSFFLFSWRFWRVWVIGRSLFQMP